MKKGKRILVKKVSGTCRARVVCPTQHKQMGIWYCTKMQHAANEDSMYSNLRKFGDVSGQFESFSSQKSASTELQIRYLFHQRQ